MPEFSIILCISLAVTISTMVWVVKDIKHMADVEKETESWLSQGEQHDSTNT